MSALRRTDGLLKDRVVVLAGYGPGLGAALAVAQRRGGRPARHRLAHRRRSWRPPPSELRRPAPRRCCRSPPTSTTPTRARRLSTSTLAEFGQVDVLFNNAFRMPPMDPLTVVDHARSRRAIATNVLAPLRLASVFADALQLTQGNIVMVNSAVLWQSQPEFAAYKLTKGAMLHMAQSLATELGPRGIRVNSIAPSYIYEDLNKMYFDWLAKERGVTHQDIYDEKAAAVDLRRLATAERGRQCRSAAGLPAGERGHRRLPRRELRGVPPVSGRVRERDSVGTFEDLHAAATRMTGLDDFGADEYHEPLQRPARLLRARGGADRRRQHHAAVVPARRAGGAAAVRGRLRQAPRRTPTSRSSGRSS